MRSQVARNNLTATHARNLRTLLLLNVFEPEEIGDRIKQARERAGLRQEDLADLIGMSTRQVQNYESGDSKQYAKLKAIADATGSPVEWLLHGDDGASGQGPADFESLAQQVADTREDVRRLLEIVEELRGGPSQATPASRRASGGSQRGT